MTASTGKMNRLTVPQLMKVWELFEDTVPADKTEWFEIHPTTAEVRPFLVPYVGRKWNAIIFSAYATATLGYLVKASNVNGLLKGQGYVLRKAKKAKKLAEIEKIKAAIRALGACVSWPGPGTPPWKDL